MACRYDQDLTLTWVDNAFQRTFGAGTIGRCVLDLWPEGDRAGLAQSIARITPDHPRVTNRHRSVSADGFVKWQEWTDQGVFDEHGKIVEYHALGKDVTAEIFVHDRRLAAEDRLRRAIAASGVGTWEHTLSSRIDMFDARALQILGYPSDTPLDQVPPWQERVHPDDLPRTTAQWERAAAGDAHWDSEYRVRSQSGSWIWVHSFAIDRSEDKIVGIISDVSERRNAQDRLRDSERRLQFALQAAHEGLWDLEVATQRMELSDRASQLLGLVGTCPPDGWLQLVHEDDRQIVARALAGVIDGTYGDYAIEHRVRHPDGDVIWIHNRASALDRDMFGRATRLVGLLGDVTDRRRTMLQFEYLAHHDTLTALLNRRAFWKVVGDVLDQREPAALVLVDLDNFKPVNDDHGHDIGDRLLVEVASRLRAVVRRSDTTARLGGDEFALLCPNFEGPRDERIVVRILAAMAQPFMIQGIAISISASAGVAIVSGSDTTDQLYARADGALYTAKRAGRNRYVMADAPAETLPSTAPG